MTCSAGSRSCAGLFWIEALDQFGGALEIGKEHRHLLPFAFQSAAGGADLFRQIGGCIRERRALLGAGWWRGGRQREAGSTSPDEAAPRIVVYLWVGIEQFVLEIGEGLVVEGKLPLEGPVGHPAAPLQHGDRLVKDLFKGHCPPSRGRGGVPKTL